MPRRTPPTDAEMRERALARWEGEGGALAPSSAAGSIDDTEMRILARVGAATLDDWAKLPPDLQQGIVRRAKSLGASDHAHVKERLAQFLQKHRSEC